jgi:hypothetical protein
MSATTLNGATHPSLPQPGQGGVRGYDSCGVGSISEERERVRERGVRDRLLEVTHGGLDDIDDADGVRDTLRQQMDLVSAILTVVIAGAVAYAGLNVMSSLGETMSLTSNSTFYDSSQALESGIESFFTNMPTVFVVIALVLIIGYLTILRR